MSEQTLGVYRPSMFRNHPFYFIMWIVLVPAFGLGILALLIWWLRCLTTTLTVTDKRTVLRHGILAKATSEVLHSHVRNIQITQSITQRLFGVGAIGVSSSGQAGIEIAVSGIPRPESVKALIDRYRLQ